MTLALTWLVFSILIGLFARERGHSGVTFFLLSLVLTPIIGGVVVLFAGNAQQNAERRALETGTSKRCPYCAETIKAEANVCRYCGRDLLFVNVAPPRKDLPPMKGRWE